MQLCQNYFAPVWKGFYPKIKRIYFAFRLPLFRRGLLRTKANRKSAKLSPLSKIAKILLNGSNLLKINTYRMFSFTWNKLFNLSRLRYSWKKISEPQRQEMYRLICEPSEDSESACAFKVVWSVFVVRLKQLCILGYPKCPSENSDQTARMRSLIWIFTGRTYPKIRCLTLRLNIVLLQYYHFTKCSTLRSLFTCR